MLFSQEDRIIFPEDFQVEGKTITPRLIQISYKLLMFLVMCI